MLKKFEVKNYKNFKGWITIDLSKVGGYQFSTDCITDHIISKMIVYGRNATGKTNLGKALMDITSNLYSMGLYREQLGYYLNADSEDSLAEFVYTFQFGQNELIYKYKKTSEMKLYDEEVLLNGRRGFYYNFNTNEYDFENLNYLEAETVIIDRFLRAMYSNEGNEDNILPISFLRWLISNTALPIDSVLLKLDAYVKHMAMVTVGNTTVVGPRRMYNTFFDMLNNHTVLKDFEDFLNIMGIECRLVVKTLPDGQKQLYFAHNQLVPFFETASSGTLALTNLYRRFEMGNEASLMYLDEFDAFYHYEMSENIIKFFKKKYPLCQIILTTHNTNLMTNRLMRPDCVFILSRQGSLTALCDATPRELREGHNLEKMYISGEFERYE